MNTLKFLEVVIIPIKTLNKTWYSVSNSSKTFALGSLESLKIRTSVLSLQRSFSLMFIFGQKKFWVWKNFGPKENFGSEKNSWLEKILDPKKILALKNILGPKKFWVWTFFFGPVIVDFGGVLLVLLVKWVIRTPKSLYSVKSPWLVYMLNFSLLTLPLLIDFGGGLLLFLFFFFLWQNQSQLLAWCLTKIKLPT